MAIAGLVISILAILFSLYTYFVHDKKIKDQTKLINDYQLQKIEKESIEDKKAKIEASVQRSNNRTRKFLIYNTGKSKARNVNVVFQKVEEFWVNSNPCPIDILPNNSIEINFEVAIGGPIKIVIQFEWSDDFSDTNVETQTLQI